MTLRLRIEPEGAAGPHWLTLLALCGWLAGVVKWPGETLASSPRTVERVLGCGTVERSIDLGNGAVAVGYRNPSLE